MSRNKSHRIRQLSAQRYFIVDPSRYTGQWAKFCFGNDNPIVLEFGCGRGDYSIKLASMFSQLNIIGIDIKGHRLFQAAKEAEKYDLPNLRFIRARVEYIDTLFGPGEVAEIWMAFPDPFPKRRHMARRMTGDVYLRKYHRILRDDGQLHLKTDDANMFRYSIESLCKENWRITKIIQDVHGNEISDSLIQIKTNYELKYLAAGKTIKYLSASPPIANLEPDQIK